MFVDNIRYVVCTYMNDKVPKGNKIHARKQLGRLYMHEPFLSFLLVFNRKHASVVRRVTLLAYYLKNL